MIANEQEQTDLVNFETLFAPKPQLTIAWSQLVADLAAGATRSQQIIEDTCKRCERTLDDLKKAVKRLRRREENLANLAKSKALRESLPELQARLGEANAEAASEVAQHRERLTVIQAKEIALFRECEAARTSADTLEREALNDLIDPQAAEDASKVLTRANKATVEQLRLEEKARKYDLTSLSRSVAAKEAELAEYRRANPGVNEKLEPSYIGQLRNDIAERSQNISSAKGLLRKAATHAAEATEAAIYYNSLPPADGLPPELSRSKKMKRFSITYKGEPTHSGAKDANVMQPLGLNPVKEGTPDATTEIVAIDLVDAIAMFNDSRTRFPSSKDPRWQNKELPL